ncbi:hypothetical protein BGX27_005709 [Mortierella sp. AM989]|nr:hypothetical protein BGX27_005709 [Mortierella sp. AM989]
MNVIPTPYASFKTTNLFDSIIPGKALSEVDSDEPDDGLPILEMNHDSASDSEVDNYDEVGDYSSDVSDSEPETGDDIVHPDASDPPHESTETTPPDPVELTPTPPNWTESSSQQ